MFQGDLQVMHEVGHQGGALDDLGMGQFLLPQRLDNIMTAQLYN